MKGIIFTEFLEMTEAKFGYETVDKIINESNLPSQGAYTSIGTYSHKEMISLVVGLHNHSNISIDELLKSFGHQLFSYFEKNYSNFIEIYQSGFDMLENVEDYIHKEVIKLYPDAELPKFQTERIDKNTLKMVYSSDRSMSSLAEGLIESVFLHFGENVEIKKEILDLEGKSVNFLIQIQ